MEILFFTLSLIYYPRNYIIVAILGFLFILSLFSNSSLPFSFTYFHLLACSLTSLSRSLIHLFVQLLAHSLAHYFTHTFARSLYSLAHSLTQSLIPFGHLLAQSLIHSPTHPLTHFLSISARLSPSLSSLFMLCIL